MGFRVWGLRFGVWGLEFEVWGLGFGVLGLGFGVWGLGFGVKNLVQFFTINLRQIQRRFFYHSNTRRERNKEEAAEAFGVGQMGTWRRGVGPLYQNNFSTEM